MKIYYRIFLIIFFSLIFIVFTPLIIFYGQGYRYNFKTHSFIKTGNLFIKSIPSEALIILNNQKIKPKWYQKIFFYKKLIGLINLKSTTPTLIPYLLPDEYLIKIEKENYLPYQKKIKIEAGKTLELNKVYLFLKEAKVKLLIKEQFDFLYPLPSEKVIIYSNYNKIINKSQIKLSSLREIYQIDLATLDGKILKIEDFLPYLIIHSSEKKYLLNLSDLSIINLNNFLKEISKVQLSKNLAYLQSFNTIYSFDIKNKRLKKLLNFNPKFSNLEDWFLKENNLYLLFKTQTNYVLKKIQLNHTQKEVESINLFLPKERYNLYYLSENLLVIKSPFQIFIIDLTQKDKPIILKKETKEILIDPERKKLLSYSNFEITIFELFKDQNGLTKIKENLIYRGGENLDQVIFHPSNVFLIFLSNNTIWAIEIEENFKNFYKLFSGKKIEKIWFFDNPDIFYLFGKINNQTGIWQIQIQ
jgi:hypothetical protein